MKPSITISAGLVDAGLASLATFVTGLLAVRLLEPVVLGAYALFFTAFLLASVIPERLVFMPAEVAALSHPRDRRLSILRDTLRLGAPLAVATSCGTFLAIAFVPSSVPPNAVSALVVTSMIAALLSPLQDHMRRLLHLANVSWGAAGMSSIQFTTVIAAAGTMMLLDYPTPWIPFGALAVANAVSISAGAWHVRRTRPTPLTERLQLRQMLRSGRWLLAVGMSTPAAGFLAAGIVSVLAGAAAVGLAEAARVAAQPVFTFHVGMSATLGPRSMEAAATGAEQQARHYSNLSLWAGLTLSILYFLAVGAAWSWNPLVAVLPNAYEIPGLVALTIIANTLTGIALPYSSELVGARLERVLTGIEVGGNGVRIAIAAAAVPLRSAALPLGLLVLGVVRAIAYRVAVKPIYRSVEEQGTTRPFVG